jgi:hypothetical protein
MAAMAVASVPLLPWAPSGCAGAEDRSNLAMDATASSPAPTTCQPGHSLCTTSGMCCSGICSDGRCADPRPPPAGPWCPDLPPRAGDFCSVSGMPWADRIACEYGESPVPACDELYTCKGQQWQLVAPDSSDTACAPNADSCPASWSDIPTGMSCAPPNMHCDYSGVRCDCAQNASVLGWPATWWCPLTGVLLRGTDGGWTSIGACPLPRPRLGTVCHDLGAGCDYGACQIRGGNRQTCVSGIWVAQPEECACPATQPDAGDPCMWEGPQCEYGSSPLAQCNTFATCAPPFGPVELAQWALSLPEAGPPCSPAPPSQCPAPDQPIEGAACATPSLDCDYGDKRCECATGPSRQSTTATWRCTDPVLAHTGCGARPHLGTPCPQNGLSCNYGACEIAGGTFEVCLGGVWRQVTPGCVSCPPSAPEAGTPCTSGICEYGTSNVYDCDTIAVCWPPPLGPPMPAWIVSSPDAGGAACQTPPQGMCPASFDAVPRDAGCDGAPSFCDYSQGRCRCAADPGTAGPTWSCQDPAPSCPRPRARLGSDCWQDGLNCAYDPCGGSDGIAQICANGVWTRFPIDCQLDAGLPGTGSE